MLIEGTELNFTLSTPNKLFEAMTAGVPVVCSDLPMIAAIVEGEQIGAVVRSASAEGLAGAVRELLADREGLAVMAEPAVEAARRTYHWAAQAERLVKAYERLWEESPPPTMESP